VSTDARGRAFVVCTDLLDPCDCARSLGWKSGLAFKEAQPGGWVCMIASEDLMLARSYRSYARAWDEAAFLVTDRRGDALIMCRSCALPLALFRYVGPPRVAT
jgi:hypothetical protein